MSGAPLAIIAPTMPVAEGLRWLALALAAVPAALRWRLGLGAGVALMDGRQALSFGMEARDIARVVDGRLTTPGGLDLVAGERYVRWLRARATRCRTTTELAALVDDRLSSFARWDACAPELPWPRVARAIGADLAEDERLERLCEWLDAPTAALPSVDLPTRRERAIEAIVGQLRAETTRVLEAVSDTSWGAAWARVAEHGAVPHALATMLGFAPLTGAPSLRSIAHLDLPEPLPKRAGQALRRALDDGTIDLPGWRHVLTRTHGERPWLAEIRETLAPTLLARSFRDADGSSGLDDTLGETRVGRALSSLCARRELQPSARALAKGLAPLGREIASLAVERVFQKSADPIATCYLRDAFAAQRVITALPDAAAVARALVVELPRRTEPLSPSIVEALLVHELDALRRSPVLAGSVGAALPPPIAGALLGAEGSAGASCPAVVIEVAARTLEREERALARFLDAAENDDRALGRRVLSAYQELEPAPQGVLGRWLHAALRGALSRPLPELDRRGRARLATALELALGADAAADLLGDAHEAETLVWLLGVMPGRHLVQPPPIALRRILALAAAERDVVRAAVGAARARALGHAPGWRCLAAALAGPSEDGPPENALSDAEQDALDSLSDPEVAALALRGLFASDERLASLGRCELVDRDVSLRSLVEAAHHARAASAPALSAVVARHALVLARREGVPASDARGLLHPPRWMDRVRRTFAREAPDSARALLTFVAADLDERARAELLAQSVGGHLSHGGPR